MRRFRAGTGELMLNNLKWRGGSRSVADVSLYGRREISEQEQKEDNRLLRNHLKDLEAAD